MSTRLIPQVAKTTALNLATALDSSWRDEERLACGLTKVDFALGYYRHLKKLRVYVDQHWQEPILLADIALSIGVSSSQLSRLFSDKTGIRFSDWLRYRRIQKAQDLLKSDDMAISDIAFSTGFRNSRSFERAFKIVNGISATEYRKTIVKQNVSHD